MPRDQKKRGRRAEKQRQTADHSDGPPAKRRRTSNDAEDLAVSGYASNDFINFGQEQHPEGEENQQITFYGLLTEEEQEYYANVNNKISANDFESNEHRAMFIEAVYRESLGKEIKIASSQSCSRYLEKIIRLSTPAQMKSLFLAFLQDLDYLVQHRFGSHCCETLFIESAPHVDGKSKTSSDREHSLEALFLEAAEKLKANVGFLLTERFASHTLRVLLLVLSGQSLEDASAQEIVASRKKEKIELSQPSEPVSPDIRKVPKSFRKAWRDLARAALSSLDTTYVRALATQPLGSPILQLLLRLELSDSEMEDDSDNSVMSKLIPDQSFEHDSDSGKFVSSLVYDSVGAYLVQTLVRYLPGKSFKKMYRNLFRERIGKLAKNEIASYVAISIFERVGKDDLSHACEAMVPEIPGLVERNRLAVLRALIERCSVRAVSLQLIKDALTEVYGKKPASVLHIMLKLNIASISTTEVEKSKDNSFTDIQGSLLAQAMLRTEDLSGMIQGSLLAQEDGILLRMANNATSSRIIQVALTVEATPTSFSRQMVPRFYDMVADLAIDPSGSHVIDALWTATDGSHFMKERIAKLLQSNEQKLRDSLYGRTIWKNWAMDTYQRRNGEWQAIARGRALEAPEEKEKKSKPAIELARERHMQKQSRSNQSSSISTVKVTA